MARKSNNTALNILTANQNSGLLDNKLSKSVTFVVGTTGAIGTVKIANVTGIVAIQLFAVCSVDVTGSGTIEIGTAASTAGLIAQTTGTAIDAGEIWHDATPDVTIELTSVITSKIVTANVNYKITSDTLTGGTVIFYILWSPISNDGLVELA